MKFLKEYGGWFATTLSLIAFTLTIYSFFNPHLNITIAALWAMNMQLAGWMVILILAGHTHEAP